MTIATRIVQLFSTKLGRTIAGVRKKSFEINVKNSVSGDLASSFISYFFIFDCSGRICGLRFYCRDIIIPGGGIMARRMKWGSLEDLKDKIETYFETEPLPTIPGFCLYMGITKECFSYYANERYKYKHKSEEEKAEILKEIDNQMEERAELEALEDYVTIASNVEVIDNYDGLKKYDKSAEDTIKRQLSEQFKNVRLKIEEFNIKTGYTAKNPAFSIFMSKAVFDYRETAPEQTAINQLPSKITIQIMPAPDQPQLQPAKINVKSE
jgi:hypothetical protein